MAKLKNTGMIRVGNAVLKERNPACFSCKNLVFLQLSKVVVIQIYKKAKNTRHIF